jgi:cytochrome c553
MAAAATASAQGDAEAARWIVQSFCATCHDVPGMPAPAEAPAGPPPSFQAMADEPEVYTEARMTAFLRDPHFPMDQIELSDEDIANLVAFIEGLRRPGASERSELDLDLR